MSAEQPPLDTARRFVRLSKERANGFVEFEFAIGEPEVFAELILSRQAFDEFCAANAVEVLPSRPAGEVHADWDWRLSDVTRVLHR
jgi:phenol hydroxylase P0 protein